MRSNKNNFVFLIIIAVVFGLAAGIVGNLISESFINGGYFGAPFYGEINFGAGQGQNIVIKDAKKVVVEQNNKVEEATSSAKGSLVGIFKKISLPEPSVENTKINLTDFYKLGQESGEGMIITSDGWIISAFTPDNLNYVIISQDKKIYQIDKIVKDSLTGINFIHAAAKDFPVLKFAERSKIRNGQLAIAVSWNGESMLSAIADGKNTDNNFLFFSDSFPDEIILTDEFRKDFSGRFIFNLSGEVVGVLDNIEKIRPISHLEGALDSLLKLKEISRPSLGVNYVDLSRIVSARPEKDFSQYEKGALVYKNLSGVSIIKGSATEKAGLEEGDIIISVEGILIDYNNNLTDVIQSFSAGDRIDVVYSRRGEEAKIEVELGYQL